MSGRTQSEHGPVGGLEPPVGVVSIPIPCGLDFHCDGSGRAVGPSWGGSHAIRSLSFGFRCRYPPIGLGLCGRAHFPHQGGRTGTGLRRGRPGFPRSPDPHMRLSRRTPQRCIYACGCCGFLFLPFRGRCRAERGGGGACVAMVEAPPSHSEPGGSCGTPPWRGENVEGTTHRAHVVFAPHPMLRSRLIRSHLPRPRGR